MTKHPRCWWGTSTPDYVAYHDTEWGFGVADDHRLFEKLCLEGFQSGLSWLTILRKRENFRAAFAGFDPHIVAAFDESDVDRLLADAGIIRHGGKIRSTINNAARALGADRRVRVDRRLHVAARHIRRTADRDTGADGDLHGDFQGPQSGAAGHSSGPTTVYAFMQAMGLVNDHLDGCWVRQPSERARRKIYGEHKKGSR